MVLKHEAYEQPIGMTTEDTPEIWGEPEHQCVVLGTRTAPREHSERSYVNLVAGKRDDPKADFRSETTTPPRFAASAAQGEVCQKQALCDSLSTYEEDEFFREKIDEWAQKQRARYL